MHKFKEIRCFTPLTYNMGKLLLLIVRKTIQCEYLLSPGNQDKGNCVSLAVFVYPLNKALLLESDKKRYEWRQW